MKWFKLAGLVVGLVGLFAAFLNLQGCFADKEKLDIAKLIRESEGPIPRSTPAFEKFLSDFPPPHGIDSTAVTHIVKNRIQTHDQFIMNGVVRYFAKNQKTTPVATFEDVRIWAEETIYAWISWFIMFGGWLMVAVVCGLEIFERKSAS